MKRKNSLFLRVAAFCLVLILAAPIPVQAASKDPAMPCVSDYVTSYNIYVERVGSRGEIQIHFNLRAKSIMDDIGVRFIELYEVNSNGTLTLLTIFYEKDHSNFMEHNTFYHDSHISYMGSTSKTYRVYAHFWAGKNGDGDNRFKWGSMI